MPVRLKNTQYFDSQQKHSLHIVNQRKDTRTFTASQKETPYSGSKLKDTLPYTFWYSTGDPVLSQSMEARPTLWQSA